MHIPGHVIDPTTAIGTGILSAGILAEAVRRSRGDLKRQLPLIAVTSACLGAAQAVNFPVAGGTSGHLLGGALAGILLGPWAGMLIVAGVLVVQCLAFNDGGAMALGANVFNMAIVGAGGGYALYHLAAQRLTGFRGQVLAAGLASGLTVLLAATLCSLELSLGGQFALLPTLSAMLAAHLPVAIAEGLTTTLVLALVWQTGPERAVELYAPHAPAASSWRLIAAGVGTAAALAAMAPFASTLPDGLETTLDQDAVPAAE